MMRALGLQREKIAATFDKRELARSIAVAVDSLCAATKTRGQDFWINVDLTVHLRDGTAFEKHARINVYVPSDVGHVASPNQTRLVRVQAQLDEMTIATGMACVVKTLATSVQALQNDFWVNVDLNVHINRGKAYEKKARLNVYGDLVDPCDTTVTESADWNKVPSEILGTLCEDLEEIKE